MLFSLLLRYFVDSTEMFLPELSYCSSQSADTGWPPKTPLSHCASVEIVVRFYMVPLSGIPYKEQNPGYLLWVPHMVPKKHSPFSLHTLELKYSKHNYFSWWRQQEEADSARPSALWHKWEISHEFYNWLYFLLACATEIRNKRISDSSYSYSLCGLK